MSSDSPHVEPVVRARRLEIVDDAGRVRAVIGDVRSARAPSELGVAIFDESGQRRAWLTLTREGPVLAFDLAGNCAVELGVNDAGADALQVGAHLVLSDSTGALAVGWWVEDDGSVTMRTGGR